MSPQRGISLLIILAVSAQTAALAQRSFIDAQPVRLPQREKAAVPVRKELSIEDLFPKTEIPYAYPNPVDLNGMTVGGLSEKNSTTLGANLFVVVDNTKYTTMAELYKANRLKGKSSFVTVDALMHSFLAVRNGMLANCVEDYAMPDLISLLVAMMKGTAADYKEAEDTEVRNDLEKNLAFLSVAVKLLDPSLPSAQLGSSTGWATKELQNIRSLQKKRSAIFGVEEDFSSYRPIGWYNASTKLQNFFRAKQWLSRVSFLLSENTASNGAGDSFRRSALMFRALHKSAVGSQTGLQVWQRLNGLMTQLGPTISTEVKTLTPNDYKEVFKTTADGDLRMSLQGLAEPFYRTKLLLSVRRQRPMQISSTSIFDIDSSHPERATQACFRLFPIIEQPELSWLQEEGHHYAKEGSDIPAPPLALLDLHAHGVTQSTNVLGDNIWKLDPTLVNVVPGLVQALKKQPNKDFIWHVLGNYFKMPTDAVQAVLKTNNWMTRKLESGFGAWLDSQLAISSAVPKKNEDDDDFTPILKPANSASIPASLITKANSASIFSPATTSNGYAVKGSAAATANGLSFKGSAAASTSSTATSSASTSLSARSSLATSPRTTSLTATANLQGEAGAVLVQSTPLLKHYVEPCPDVFRNMRTEMERLTNQLRSIGYIPKKFDTRVQQLTALLQKLESIASKEVNGVAPQPADAAFLGNIDIALENFSPPTASTLYLDTGISNEDNLKDSLNSGATLALGRPAMLFIIFQSGRSLTVARGAMYSYHELAGGPIKPEHLERKMEFGFLTPPQWTEQFEIIQDQPPIGGN